MLVSRAEKLRRARGHERERQHVARAERHDHRLGQRREQKFADAGDEDERKKDNRQCDGDDKQRFADLDRAVARRFERGLAHFQMALAILDDHN